MKTHAMDRLFGRCALYFALLINAVLRLYLDLYRIVEGLQLVCRHAFEVACLRRFLYLCRPAKNVITLVVTWVVPIGGLWGGRTLEVRPQCDANVIGILKSVRFLNFCNFVLDASLCYVCV